MAATRRSRQDKSDAKKSKKKFIKKRKVAVAQTRNLAPAAGDDVKVAGRALAPDRPKSDAELRSMIEGIGAPSLHDEDIATALKHLNSVTTFRAAVGRRGRAPKAVLGANAI